MEEQFIAHKHALALKELGFDEPCFAFYAIPNVENKLFFDIDPDDGELTSLNQNQIYHNNLSEVGRISAPLKQQAFRWFREKYNWTIKVNQVTKNNWSYTLDNFPKDRTYYGEVYKTYEEAESGCIDKLIEIIKKK
jgi:hypothetical protein